MPRHMAAKRHHVSTVYRGRRVTGEWFVQDGLIHVASFYGSKSAPIHSMGTAGAVHFPMPSDVATQMLWELLPQVQRRCPVSFLWRR